MKKIICLVMLLLVIPFTCQAHEIMGYMPERTKAFTKAIEVYFRDKYNLKLKNKLNIVVAEKTKQYETVLKILEMPDAEDLTYNTMAVTEGDYIVINGDCLMDRHFYFTLAHEMVHRYQMEYWKDMKSDYVMTEGLADLIAEDISKYEIKINDHGIPYEELKSKKGYKENLEKRNNETIQQVRYYAKQSPGFMAYVDKSKIGKNKK